MSGGQFGYSEYHLFEIADEIEAIMRRQGQRRPEDEVAPSDLPEERNYPVYSPEVRKVLRDAVDFLRVAGNYAKQVDLFLSQDTSEDYLLEKIRKLNCRLERQAE